MAAAHPGVILLTAVLGLRWLWAVWQRRNQSIAIVVGGAFALAFEWLTKP